MLRKSGYLEKLEQTFKTKKENMDISFPMTPAIVTNEEAKFYVYRNLRKKCLSVRHRGIVKAHIHSKCAIINPEFRVHESGRARVLKNKAKNVHAYIVTRTIYPDIHQFGGNPINLKDFGNPVKVTYNPYAYSSFVRADHETPVKSADLVIVDESGNMAAYGVK